MIALVLLCDIVTQRLTQNLPNCPVSVVGCRHSNAEKALRMCDYFLTRLSLVPKLGLATLFCLLFSKLHVASYKPIETKTVQLIASSHNLF